MKASMPKRDRSREARDLREICGVLESHERMNEYDRLPDHLQALSRVLRAFARRIANLELRRDRTQERRRRPAPRRRKGATA